MRNRKAIMIIAAMIAALILVAIPPTTSPAQQISTAKDTSVQKAMQIVKSNYDTVKALNDSSQSLIKQAQVIRSLEVPKPVVAPAKFKKDLDKALRRKTIVLRRPATIPDASPADSIIEQDKTVIVVKQFIAPVVNPQPFRKDMWKGRNENGLFYQIFKRKSK